MIHGYFKGTLRIFQGCSKDTSPMLQWYCKYASIMLKDPSLCAMDFPQIFQEVSMILLAAKGERFGLISVSYLFKLIVTILYLSINNFCLPNQITVPPLTIITIMVGCDFAIQLYSYSVPPEDIDPFESTGSRMDWKMFLVAEQLYTHPCVSISGSVCMFPILCKKIIGFKYT